MEIYEEGDGYMPERYYIFSINIHHVKITILRTFEKQCLLTHVSTNTEQVMPLGATEAARISSSTCSDRLSYMRRRMDTCVSYKEESTSSTTCSDRLTQSPGSPWAAALA